MTGPATVELAIGGMTSASCAARVERRLNRLEGVTATVNLATGTARVAVPDELDAGELVAAVEAAGYRATLPHRPAPGPATDADPGPGPDGRLRARLVVAVALSVPVVALAMVPWLRFEGWPAVALALNAPVATWAAWPFHRAALANLGHGAATMDTLVSIGVLAAFGWSVSAVASGGDHLYLEVAAGVTTLVLAGRLAEARARRRAGAALRSLLELGARDVAVVRDGQERRIPVERLAVGDRFLVRPGGAAGHRRRGRGGQLGR